MRRTVLFFLLGFLLIVPSRFAAADQDGATKVASSSEEAGSSPAQPAEPRKEEEKSQPERKQEVVPAEAWTEMEVENPTVGTTITYHVKVVLPEGRELQLPDNLQFAAGLKPLKEGVTIRKKLVDSGNEWEATIPMVLVRFGKIKIPERDFPVKGVEGMVGVARAGKMTIVTGSYFANVNEPEPAPALSPVPIPERNWLAIWISVLLGVVAVAVLVTVVVLNRRRARAPKPEMPKRPPHEVAIEKLDDLVKKELPELGEFALFYTLLSEILREYLGGRWGFDSLDMTTTELIGEMRSKAMDNYLFERLCDQLHDFDLVKFAKLVPSRDRCREDEARARRFIEETVPQNTQEVGK